MNAVELLGARIVLSFANFPAVVAEIDPEKAPMFRDLPFVNYL